MLQAKSLVKEYFNNNNNNKKKKKAENSEIFLYISLTANEIYNLYHFIYQVGIGMNKMK